MSKNIVQNGGFASQDNWVGWSDDWYLESGKAAWNGETGTLYQNVPVILSRLYTVQFTLSSVTFIGGNLTVKLGGTTVGTYTTNGIKTVNNVVAGSNGKLEFIATWDGGEEDEGFFLDDVSVTPEVDAYDIDIKVTDYLGDALESITVTCKVGAYTIYDKTTDSNGDVTTCIVESGVTYSFTFSRSGYQDYTISKSFTSDLDWTLGIRFMPPTVAVGSCPVRQLLPLIIADLEALTGDGDALLFKKVGTFLKSPKALSTPACAVWPENDPDESNGITNISTFTDCRFVFGFGIKGTKDSTIIDKALECRYYVKRFFESEADYQGDVPGLVDIAVETRGLSVEDKAPDGALLFGSGITVICKVQRQT